MPHCLKSHIVAHNACLVKTSENCIQNLLCTQIPFGNYWAFAVLSGQDLIANLSDGLKIMDSSFITCDDIGKLSFYHKLETCEAAFWPL